MVESLNVESARYSMMVVLGSNFSSKASATIPPIESESIVSPVENTYLKLGSSLPSLLSAMALPKFMVYVVFGSRLCLDRSMTSFFDGKAAEGETFYRRRYDQLF